MPLPQVLQEAAQQQATELVVEVGRPPVAQTAHGTVSIGPAMSERELFDALEGLLAPEQLAELAVGNIVEFHVDVAGGRWTLLGEPSIEGMTVRGRLLTEGSLEFGDPLHLPPLEPFSGSTTPRPSTEDPIDAAFSALTDEGPDDWLVRNDERREAATPLPMDERGQSFALSAAARFDDTPADHRAQRIEPPPAAGSEGDELRFGDPVADFHGFGDPSASFGDPSASLGDLSDFDDPSGVALEETSFGVETRFGDDLATDPSAPMVDLPLEQPLEGGAFDGAWDQLEAGGMMDTQGAPSSGADDGELPDLIEPLLDDLQPAPILQTSATRADLEQASAAFAGYGGSIPRGTLCVIQGRGIAEALAEQLDGGHLVVIDKDTHQHALDEVPSEAPGGTFVVRLEDPSEILSWMLRRLEEGGRVVVETQARTVEGARRILLGVRHGPRAETWLDAHPMFWVSQRDGAWTVRAR